MFLNCHTYFSLRYGALSPEKLVANACKLGIKTLCLTDINNTSAFFDFLSACRKNGIKPLTGIEFRTEDFQPIFTGIAKNHQGVFELNKKLTAYSFSNKQILPETSALENAFIIYPFHAAPASLQPNEFIGIRSYELNRLYSSPWKQHPEKLLAWHPVTFLDEQGFHIHKLLRAIDQNTLLSKLDLKHAAHASESLISEKELALKFQDYPELVANTTKLLDACSLEIDLTILKNRKHFIGKEEDKQLLLTLANEGFKDRYGESHAVASERLAKELIIIEEQNFTAYYLITHDIVSYAKRQGYRHVGRGSGANSIVAYCLKLTDVDPIELDLYFERFINPYRSSPPDFDMDFCWDERDDVYNYIFERFGKEYVALLATYATFQRRAIVRELGKVYGLPKADIDVLANEPRAKEKHHSLGAEIYEYGEKLVDFPNHLSIHAGGVLITEEPLCCYTALESMPKGYPVTHFDMHVAEENHFYKYDILSQRGLGHIKETIRHVAENQGIHIDIDRVKDFKKDDLINEKLANAKTTGCFYIESPAMRGLLAKLKCDNYLTLVAASSVIRPGVAKSGMMREFIYRHHHPQEVKYLHETFRQNLGETYGVMVYQEDVIKIAHYFGGLDLGEADVLRRIMSGKSRGNKLEKLEKKYFENCSNKGYPQGLAQEIWRQIESFAGFSFCKAHSASFAVESYQSLFLKTYYPLEFMVGVINNFGGFYNTELYVHEARMEGADVQPPCVNHSDYLTNIKAKTIHLGFIHLKDLEKQLAEKIIKERNHNGPFQSLDDFIQRTGIRKEQSTILIRIGALRFTGLSKQELLWGRNKFRENFNLPSSHSLFTNPSQPLVLPPLETDPLEDIFDQVDLLGFPLVSPFNILKTKFRGEIQAKNMMQAVGKSVRIIGYYICQKDLRTSNGKPMYFGTWIDHEGNFFDTTHFPSSLEHFPFRGKGCYLILGKIVEDFGFPSIEVEKMAKLEIQSVS